MLGLTDKAAVVVSVISPDKSVDPAGIINKKENRKEEDLSGYMKKKVFQDCDEHFVEIAFAQHFHPATTNVDSSTPLPEMSTMVMFYMLPVITFVILSICLFCMSYGIRLCRANKSTGRSMVPTISGSVQNRSHGEPPPPYTFTDISQGQPLPELSFTNCPSYTKDPPAYLELTVVSENNPR